MMRSRFLIAATILSAASPALALQWHVDPVTSKLTFEGEQAGEKFQGSFPKFSSTIYFDEATPESCRIHIAISTSNIQVDGKDRLDALPTDDWFAVKKFPFAEFSANECKRTGEHQYNAIGSVGIRGIEKPVTLPFNVQISGKSAIARGDVTLNRADFGVGQGRWASEEWVKHAVHVSFEIRAAQ